MVRAVCCFAVATLAVAACSPDDDTATPPTDQTTAPADVEPIPPVTAATPTVQTGAPSSSSPKPRVDVGSPGVFPATWSSAIDLAPVPAAFAPSPGGDYDLSPNGSSFASLSSDSLCLGPIDDPGTATCRPLGDADRFLAGLWSPDSTVFATYSALPGDAPRPVYLVGRDGAVTAVPPEESAVVSPTQAAFVDATTVVMAGYVGDDRTAMRLAVADTAGRVVTSDPVVGSDGSLFWEIRHLAAEAPFVVARIDSLADVGRNEFRLYTVTSDANGLHLEDVGVIEGTNGFADDQPRMVRAGVLLVGDRFSVQMLMPDSADNPTLYGLVPVAGGAVAPVPNQTDLMPRAAALSPDGGHLAVVWQYVGTDQSLRDSALFQFSVATTTSILSGQPAWFNFASLPGPALADGMLHRDSQVVWTSSTRVTVEMSDGVYALDLVPAG